VQMLAPIALVVFTNPEREVAKASIALAPDAELVEESGDPIAHVLRMAGKAGGMDGDGGVEGLAALLGEVDGLVEVTHIPVRKRL